MDGGWGLEDCCAFKSLEANQRQPVDGFAFPFLSAQPCSVVSMNCSYCTLSPLFHFFLGDTFP